MLLPILFLAPAGCFKVTRAPEDVKAIPASEVKFAIEAPCTAAAASAAVENAGRDMELSVEETPQKPGDPWLLRRGIRLADGPLWYRIDIAPAASAPGASTIRVHAVAVSLGVTDTQETLSKPGALAMRIVAACAGGGH